MGEKHIKNYIKQNEGMKNTVYLDSRDNLTVGWGHLLTDGFFSLEEKRRIMLGTWFPTKALELLFEDDYEDVLEDFRLLKRFYNLSKLNKRQEMALKDMLFNMGLGGVMGFKNTLAFLEAGEFHEASKEVLKSNYAEQVPNRASQNSELLLG